MYSRQEASRIRQEFWTRLGQYMRPVLSAEGETINWINYRTGEQNIHFRMEADNKGAWIGLVISHADAGLRELYWEQLHELKSLFEQAAGTNWDWIPAGRNPQGAELSLVQKTLNDVSIFREQDWPALISFFKEELIRLDRFWAEAKYAFESLR